jgi:dual specificity phosphatase 12
MSLSSRAASIQSTSGRELIDEVPWRRGNEVAPGLFVGDLETARALRFTSENKISAVVSVCADYVSAEDSSFGMWHLRVNVTEEGADLLTYLPRAVAFVAFALSQGRRVLVHSVRGQSRAPAVAAAYCECSCTHAEIPTDDDTSDANTQR